MHQDARAALIVMGVVALFAAGIGAAILKAKSAADTLAACEHVCGTQKLLMCTFDGAWCIMPDGRATKQ